MAFLLTPDNAQYKLDKKKATTWKSIKVQIYHAANDTFVWCTCTCIQTENSVSLLTGQLIYMLKHTCWVWTNWHSKIAHAAAMSVKLTYLHEYI